MSPRFVLEQENVPCVAEVVNRSLKADCTDFMNIMIPFNSCYMLVDVNVEKEIQVGRHCQIQSVI